LVAQAKSYATKTLLTGQILNMTREVATDCLTEYNGFQIHKKEAKEVAKGVVEDLVTLSVKRSEEAKKESLVDGVLERLLSLLVSEQINCEFVEHKKFKKSEQYTSLVPNNKQMDSGKLDDH